MPQFTAAFLVCFLLFELNMILLLLYFVNVKCAFSQGYSPSIQFLKHACN